MYFRKYQSPCGIIIMKSDGTNLTGLCFEKSNDELKHKEKLVEQDLQIFDDTTKWLDIYFSGKDPGFTPKYKINDLTPFREEVINVMKNIPYGKTITYNDISKIIAKNRNIKKMSSQAVGGAVGWNPICIIIPCHRVMGQNNNITGYGGGIDNKVWLLNHEGQDTSKYKYPKNYRKEN